MNSYSPWNEMKENRHQRILYFLMIYQIGSCVYCFQCVVTHITMAVRSLLSFMKQNYWLAKKTYFTVLCQSRAWNKGGKLRMSQKGHTAGFEYQNADRGAVVTSYTVPPHAVTTCTFWQLRIIANAKFQSRPQGTKEEAGGKPRNVRNPPAVWKFSVLRNFQQATPC